MAFFKNLFNKKETITTENNSVKNEDTLQISMNDILLSQVAESKDAALAIVAKTMLNNGYVKEDYLPALKMREEQVSTYLINGVAIPHGTKEAKSKIEKTGIIIAQFPDGVIWNDAGDKVYLAVGIAAKGDEHLDILAKLTGIVMDEELSKKLGTTATAQEITAALGQEVSITNDLSVLEVQAEVAIVDEAGMHARPATIIAQMAESFTKTVIHLTKDGKTVSALSSASILTLGGSKGDKLIVSASGDEAEKAVDEIAKAIAAGLDNEQSANNTYNPLEGLAAIENPKGEQIIEALSASNGIAKAKIFVFEEEDLDIQKNTTDLNNEKNSLHSALSKAQNQLEELYEQVKQKSQEDAIIFKAQQQLLKDNSIIRSAEDIILAGHSAAWAWDTALKDQIAALEAIDDERIRERAADMRDIANRVTRILTNKSDKIHFPDEEFILVAKELTPSQTAYFGNAKIMAICSQFGGPNSHMAILSRALGIPALVGAGDGLLSRVKNDDMAILDASAAKLIINPDDETLNKADKLIAKWHEIKDIEASAKMEEAITTDGHKVHIVCNIASVNDAKSVLENGGEGVGLLRSEFLFEASSREPSLEKQFEALKEIVAPLEDKTIIIRTADIGGDKPVSWLDMPKEENPFLGIRGVRLSFKHEEMFKNQLRAIYKTAIWQEENGIKSNIHVMFPMIATLNEWQKAKSIATSIQEELNAPKLPLGIMVEVPSTAILADYFAKDVDFFSIGSNDLTQYTLAMDRLHPELAKDADSYNPALLRLIDMTIKAAKANNKWTGVCGNMAADPHMASILIGLGVEELSVSPVNVPALKLLVRSSSLQELQNRAQAALSCTTSQEVHDLYS